MSPLYTDGFSRTILLTYGSPYVHTDRKYWAALSWSSSVLEGGFTLTLTHRGAGTLFSKIAMESYTA